MDIAGFDTSLTVQLDSLREYSLQDSSVQGIAYAVQSISVGSFIQSRGFKVLIGTQNGDIYELSYESNADLDALVKISAAIDSYNIRSMACDISSSFLFTLSAEGIFSMWDLKSFSQLYSYDFKKKGIKLHVFKKKHFNEYDSKLLFIVLGFENQISLIKMLGLDSIEHEVIESFETEFTNVTDLKVSTDEKYLAVACNNDQKPQVDIHIIHSDSFTLDKNLYGFRSPVIRLDFSTDGYYLMCEDNLGEVLIFELETQNIASFHSVEFEIEWLNEGLRHATGLKSIYQTYNINNKISSITKNPALSILAIGDEYGVIALYQLPYVPGSSLLMISGHSCKINLMMFTNDDEYLITYSEHDRTILKWKLNSI